MILPACQPDTSLPQVATTSIPLTPFATLSVTHPPLPTRHLEFPNLNEAQTAAMFSIWLPNVIPDDLPFYKAGISDYADGSENVSIVYLEPGDPLDANLKMFDIQITRTDEPVSYQIITHQFKVNTLDVHEVQVRGRTGFTYWTRSGAAGNSAHLTWREGTLNFRLSLTGAWPQPDENNPHGLDSTLLKVADSLQSMPTTVPAPAVTVQILPPITPTATPDCLPVSDVAINIQRVSDTTAILHATGLQPGEIPSVFYSTSINGVDAKRGEAWGFANGADEHGEFSLQLTSLQPLEGQTKATWDIRLVHAHGVACAEITMP